MIRRVGGGVGRRAGMMSCVDRRRGEGKVEGRGQVIRVEGGAGEGGAWDHGLGL